MFFAGVVGFWLATIALFSPALCLDKGFIFPPLAANVSAPKLLDLTVHNNDSIAVEYTKLSHSVAVGLNIECTHSEKAGNETFITSHLTYSCKLTQGCCTHSSG